MKLEEAYKVFSEIKRSISKLEGRYGELQNEFEYDSENPEEKFKDLIAYEIVNNLEDINSLLKWIEKPVIATGKLIKNSNGRYEIGDRELTSGSTLDYYDEDRGWVKTRIEHNGTDYYIVSRGRDEYIDNVLVRVREY